MAACRCSAARPGSPTVTPATGKGRLIGCSHQHRCITRTELDGSVTVLADRYAGKRLNSPNDVICRSDGTIWFSDPPYGINTDYEGGKRRQSCRRPSIASTRRTAACKSWPTISQVRTALPSRPTSACSTSPRAAISLPPIRCSISASLMCRRRRAALRRPDLSPGHARLCRRVPRRPGRQRLEQRRRWRALHCPGRHQAGRHQRAVQGIEPRLRRA